MKKLLIIFLTSGLVFNSCKKDDETEAQRKRPFKIMPPIETHSFNF